MVRLYTHFPEDVRTICDFKFPYLGDLMRLLSLVEVVVGWLPLGGEFPPRFFPSSFSSFSPLPLLGWVHTGKTRQLYYFGSDLDLRLEQGSDFDSDNTSHCLV